LGRRGGAVAFTGENSRSTKKRVGPKRVTPKKRMDWAEVAWGGREGLVRKNDAAFREILPIFQIQGGKENR